MLPRIRIPAKPSDKEKPCHHWMNGDCRFGDGCRYRHEERDKGRLKSRVALDDAGEAARRQRLAQAEETKRDMVEAIARQRAEREAKEREESIRQEENRRSEEARVKANETKRKAAEEARAARIREQALKRETEREAAERKRQLEITAQREKEATAIEQYLVSKTCLVTYSAGLQIQHVVPGFDLSRIVIKNLPRDAKREEIDDLFIQQGIQRSEFLILSVKEDGKSQEAVVLINAESLQAISSGSDGIKFRDEILSFSVIENANSKGSAFQKTPFITVSWRAPAQTVFANYNSMEEAQSKSKELDKKIWKGQQIRAQMNAIPKQTIKQFVRESVKFSNCPFGSSEDEEFRQFVGSHSLRAMKSSVPFDLQESFNLIRQCFAALNGVRMDSYEVLKGGDQVDGEVKVKVEFDTWENAQAAHATIDKKQIGSGPHLYQCWVPKQLQYKIMIPLQQYESQKGQWDALGERKGADDPYVQARTTGDHGRVFIEIVGKEKKTAGPLKVRVENMIAGEKLDLEFWHPSFTSPESKSFFDEIYAKKKVFVRSDFKTRSLKIYGEGNASEEARQMIKDKVESLGLMESTRSLRREWVGYFIREGVGKLTELLGEDTEENVRLDVQPPLCQITIKGGEEAKHYLQKIIDQAREAVTVDSVLPGAREVETCPVCSCDVSHPEQLGCGHSYCSRCLKHFLTSAVDSKTFPLVCFGNEAKCNVPIAIPFIRRFLPPLTFNHLVEAAFHRYLEQHQRELKYCRTPDCKQIYHSRMDGISALQCPACFSTVCSSCNEEGHPGISCEERRLYGNTAELDRLNEELATACGYKKCRTCGAMIEKTEGCNRIQCTCGANICWKCLDVFPSAQETYAHLTEIHGGVFEED
ncbi:hypothetical protein M413DRAFT_79263 [Hebeloma cylindrosporum]|uniref:Uncharacterized protein n=1 Tax=Hebeloma cylindrosporum TaxID=76867 RepID=A0A0C3BW43_HEBCY|nr:hypothetical protein M413DRAFT_79263 [Hebeloma cylindrosporum h7]